MKRIERKLHNRAQRGASAIEYAIMAAMVAVVVVTFITPIGNAVSTTFQTICDTLTGSTCNTGGGGGGGG